MGSQADSYKSKIIYVVIFSTAVFALVFSAEGNPKFNIKKTSKQLAKKLFA